MNTAGRRPVPEGVAIREKLLMDVFQLSRGFCKAALPAGEEDRLEA